MYGSFQALGQCPRCQLHRSRSRSFLQVITARVRSQRCTCTRAATKAGVGLTAVAQRQDLETQASDGRSFQHARNLLEQL